MENSCFTIVSKSIRDLIAELVEFFLAFDEEAKWHAGIELAHMDGSGWESTVVVRFLSGYVGFRIYLWAYVVRV